MDLPKLPVPRPSHSHCRAQKGTSWLIEPALGALPSSEFALQGWATLFIKTFGEAMLSPRLAEKQGHCTELDSDPVKNRLIVLMGWEIIMGEESVGQWPSIPLRRRPSGVTESSLTSSRIQFVLTLNQLEVAILLDTREGSSS